MTRVYRYVHVSDDGRAPCSDNGLLSLATCKPAIRRTAQPGDWVMGFYPAPAPAGVLGWAARVSKVLDHGDYEQAFRGRADAVYRRDASGHMKRLRVDYHPTEEEMARDLSGPVLLFDKRSSWYFGDSPVSLPSHFQHLAARGQGHRVNGVLLSDPDCLEAWLREIGKPGLHGRPRHAEDPCGACGSPDQPRQPTC